MSVMQISPHSFAALTQYLEHYSPEFRHILPVPMDTIGTYARKPRYKSESVRLLQLMNARSYYKRYAHHAEIKPCKPMDFRELAETPGLLSHIEAYKLIHAILYNCDTYHDSRFIKDWKLFADRLADYIISETDEYKQAQWG